MKVFLTITFSLIGFVIHYFKSHAGTDISVFSVSTHAIEGTLFTVIGGVIGWFLSLFLEHEKCIVTQKGHRLYTPVFLLSWVGMGIIYLTFFPLLIVHIWCWFYQQTVFRIFHIPRLRLGDYVVLDRGKLKKLTRLQRFNCMYCGYANGLLAWLKAIGNMTELYSCAIKHQTHKLGQEHQKDFYPYRDFLKKS